MEAVYHSGILHKCTARVVKRERPIVQSWFILALVLRSTWFSSYPVRVNVTGVIVSAMAGGNGSVLPALGAECREGYFGRTGELCSPCPTGAHCPGVV